MSLFISLTASSKVKSTICGVWCAAKPPNGSCFVVDFKDMCFFCFYADTFVHTSHAIVCTNTRRRKEREVNTTFRLVCFWFNKFVKLLYIFKRDQNVKIELCVNKKKLDLSPWQSNTSFHTSKKKPHTQMGNICVYNYQNINDRHQH